MSALIIRISSHEYKKKQVKRSYEINSHLRENNQAYFPDYPVSFMGKDLIPCGYGTNQIILYLVIAKYYEVIIHHIIVPHLDSFLPEKG